MSEDGGVVEWQAPLDSELTWRLEAGPETPLRSLADLRRAEGTRFQRLQAPKHFGVAPPLSQPLDTGHFGRPTVGGDWVEGKLHRVGYTAGGGCRSRVRCRFGDRGAGDGAGRYCGCGILPIRTGLRSLRLRAAWSPIAAGLSATAQW